MSTDAGPQASESPTTPAPSSTSQADAGGAAPVNQFATIVPPETPAADTAEPQVADAADTKPGDAPDAASQQFEAFTLPEGWEIADADLQAFQEVASALEVREDGKGLTQKGAQQLVDLFIGIEQTRGEYLASLQEQQTKDRDAQWQQELQSDPEIGGDKFDAARANIAALESSGVLVPEFTELLATSGYIKAPAVIKQLAKLGSLLQESPTPIGEANSVGDGKTPAQRMFPNSGHI